MALVHADFVEETTTTTGTGTLNLAGATTGNRTFVVGIGDGNTCIYAILASNGDREVGVGTVTDATPDTLSRDTLIASTTGSKLDLTGTSTIYCTFSSEGGEKAYAAAGALGDLTDVGVGTPTSGNLLVGDGDSWESVAVSGDATLASTGAITIANAAVSLAKMANLEQDQFICRVTASTGVPETATVTAAGRAFLDDATSDAQRQTLRVFVQDTEPATPVTGDVWIDSTPNTIADGVVTLAKMANLAQDQAIMRVTASTGVPETATITAAARTVLDDTTVAAMLTTLGGQAKLTRVTASLTTANLTATVNAHHVLTISGMTAARSFVIPAGTAEGDLISWECITDAPTTLGYEMMLIGDADVTLVLGGTDRVATADDKYRYFLAGESGVLRWDATASKWRMAAAMDGRRPSGVMLYRSSSTSGNTFTSGSYVQIPFNAEVQDVGSIGNTTTGTVTTRRAGKYTFTASGALSVATDLGQITGTLSTSNKVVIALRVQNNGSRIASTPNALLFDAAANQGWAVSGETVVTTAGHTLTAEFYNTDTNGLDLVGDTLSNSGKTYFHVSEVLR